MDADYPNKGVNLACRFTARAVEAVGKVLDGLLTSDEERLDKKALLARIAQQPSLVQAEINKIEAAHRSVFVAGWRPAIGWVCAAGLAAYFLPQYVLAAWLWAKTVLETGAMQPFPAQADGLFQLVLAMLGMGALRTVEKLTGRAK